VLLGMLWRLLPHSSPASHCLCMPMWEFRSVLWSSNALVLVTATA